MPKKVNVLRCKIGVSILPFIILYAHNIIILEKRNIFDREWNSRSLISLFSVDVSSLDFVVRQHFQIFLRFQPFLIPTESLNKPPILCTYVPIVQVCQTLQNTSFTNIPILTVSRCNNSPNSANSPDSANFQLFSTL